MVLSLVVILEIDSDNPNDSDIVLNLVVDLVAVFERFRDSDIVFIRFAPPFSIKSVRFKLSVNSLSLVV